MVYGELERYPLYVTRYCRIIKFWLKILRFDNSKLIKLPHNCSFHEYLGDDSLKNWMTQVKDLLYVTGFGHDWFAQGVANEQEFLRHFKLRMKDIYLQDWNMKLSEKSKARAYSLFVSNLKVQKYLCEVKVAKHRIALTRLRMISDNLCIETGRWENPPSALADRKCTFCNELEDEYQLVLECPM